MSVFKRLSAAHSMQQIATDAARTVVAGLSEAEREQLASDCIRRATTNQTFIKTSRVNVSVRDGADNASQFTVTIKHDANDLSILSVSPSPCKARRSNATLSHSALGRYLPETKHRPYTLQ